MDIGAVALTLMLITFGLVILLDVATVGPSTFKLAKAHLKGWRAAVTAIKAKGLLIDKHKQTNKQTNKHEVKQILDLCVPVYLILKN